MKFGVREICDVVLKAKSIQKVGNKVFYKDEPVLYFDSLKTSSLEGAATTVYAQGGRGNSRLIAWEGERTITFTMEDALLSPASFAILSGAGLVSASGTNKLKTHIVERTTAIEFVAKGEEYEDYDVTRILFENKSTAEGWDNPHYPLSDIAYAYTQWAGAWFYIKNEPICHICEDENDLYNGKYMWFPADTTEFTQANAKEYYGPNYDTDSYIAENNLVFIYLKQKPCLAQVSDTSTSPPDLELNTPIYIMRVINDEVVTEPFYADDYNYTIQVVANEESPHYGEYRIALKTTDDLNKGFLVLDNPNSFTAVTFNNEDTTFGWDEPHEPDLNTIYYQYINGNYERAIPHCSEGYTDADPPLHTGSYYWFLDTASDLPRVSEKIRFYTGDDKYKLNDNVVILLDYYTEKSAGYQIDITPDKFGGNYYLEASTLFRDQNGVDLPAEFIIPNCKIQSNFTFTMASSGDPSTFTFTMDAFPDYTRFDPTKKVLTSIQILDVTSEDSLRSRTISPWSADEDASDATREKTWTGFEPANN